MTTLNPGLFPRLVILLTAWGGLPASLLAAEAEEAAKVEYFEKQVRPIFVARCYSCHSAETKPAGMLRVDDRNGLLAGGNSGPAVIPGKPAESLLLKRVAHDAKQRMPLDLDPLTEPEITVLTRWVADGAAWPALSLEPSSSESGEYYARLRQNHWAWQPLTKPPLPAVQNTGWVWSDVDQFVLARLEKAQLVPVADADKVTLLRRVTFDLTGLPPTPAEIQNFLNDTDSAAYERVVDRLLNSPAFGERWGRHWLDVARYGESTGPSRNLPYTHAWKYRDYVIDAVNAEIPFNRFIQEQVAGDLLAAESDAEQNRLRIATGFLALGVKDVNQRFQTRFLMDNVDEQIDVVTRSVLGLTVSCARCHDHKFDPVPTTDYYALAGIFTSTVNASGLRNQMGGGGLAYYVPNLLVRLNGEVPAADPEVVAKLEQEVAEAKQQFESIRGTPEGTKLGPNGRPVQQQARQKWNNLQAKLLELTDPAKHGLVAHGVRDGEKLADTEVRVRGQAELLGPVVPRGYLTAFTIPDAAPINTSQSGRLELASWLTSERNPLTPRVIVNRAWHHLFGQGLVTTVDNFGVSGNKPSHPELLDHLAITFIQEGWSLKKLVRSLVLSHTYQLSSAATEAHRQIDPANILLWRHTPRRLSAEEIRDAILAASGKLEPQRPQTATVQQFPMVEIRDNGPEAKRIYQAASVLNYRSVYLPQLRGLVPKSLEAFDPVEQTLVTGQRDATTVPGQALFMLNSPFVWNQSLALAERLSADEAAAAERVRQAYRLVLGREPREAELQRSLTFLSAYEQEYPTTTPQTVAKPANLPAEPAAVNGGDEEVIAAEDLSEAVTLPANPQAAAWTAFTQALFSTAEFRYLR